MKRLLYLLAFLAILLISGQPITRIEVADKPYLNKLAESIGYYGKIKLDMNQPKEGWAGIYFPQKHEIVIYPNAFGYGELELRAMIAHEAMHSKFDALWSLGETGDEVAVKLLNTLLNLSPYNPTKYTQYFWQQADKNYYYHLSAINETLGEIARQSVLGIKVDKEWEKLYLIIIEG